MSKRLVGTEVEALTRAEIPRKVALGSGDLSDEGLLRSAAGSPLSAERLRLLSSVSRLLRLMDALLVGRETGEGFVEKFSQQWLSICDWEADPLLEAEFDALNDFFSEIQMFCASKEHRHEEPLLFGQERLGELTRQAYAGLKRVWLSSLLGVEA